MSEAYIVEAVRTAGGRRNGALKDWHPADMAAEVLDAPRHAYTRALLEAVPDVGRALQRRETGKDDQKH